VKKKSTAAMTKRARESRKIPKTGDNIQRQKLDDELTDGRPYLARENVLIARRSGSHRRATESKKENVLVEKERGL